MQSCFFFKKKRKPVLLDYLNHYHKINSRKISSKTKLNNLIFTVIDIEATGLNSKKDKLIAFAGVKIKELKICVAESMEIIVNYDSPIRDNAIHIHEIVKDEKQAGLRQQKAIKQIIQFINNTILVGYHIQFDYQMINQLLKMQTGQKLLNPKLNIFDLINRVETPVHKIYPTTHVDLQKQCEKYGIDLEDEHTAAGDAFATAQLFLKVLKKLYRRGINTWGDLK